MDSPLSESQPEDNHQQQAGASFPPQPPHLLKAGRQLPQAEKLFRPPELQLLGLLDNISDIVARFDRELRHVYINKAITTITNLPPTAFIGKTNRELGMEPVLCDRWNQTLHQVFETGETQQTEFSYPDPTTLLPRYFQTRLTPAFDSTGQVDFVDCVSRDVTSDKISQNIAIELIQAHFARQEAEKAQKTITGILSSITDAFVALDRDYRYLYLNPKAEEILGQSKEALLGQNIWEKFPAEIDGFFYRQCHLALSQQQVLTFEVQSPELGRWIENQLYPSEEGLVIYFRDITGRKEAETRLHFQASVLSQVRDAVIATDTSERVIYWNQGAEELYGYLAEEALGRTLSELYHYTFLSPEEEQEAFTKLKTTGSWHGQALHYNRQGEVLRVEASTNLLKDTGGQTIGLLAVIRDISRRAQTEQELRESEGRLQQMVDNANVNIYVKDRHGRYLLINKNIERVFGNRPEDWLGKTDFELFPDSARLYWDNDRKVMESAQPAEWEEEVLQEDGVHVYLSRKFPLFNEKGEVSAVCGMSTDITERRRLADTLKELNYLKDLFVSITGHELRTPLTAIKGFSQLLERNLLKYQAEMVACDEEAGVRFGEHHLRPLRVIQQQADRMNQLIVQLLDFSRLQNKQLELHLEEGVDLVGLVERVVDNQRLVAGEHRLEFDRWVVQLAVRCDEARIEQVLNNLINNAVKYSPVFSLITIGLEQLPGSEPQETGQALIWVRDEGPGISEADQERIFERFYRIRNQENKRVDGLGLGLYISQQLVAGHGGKLGLESKAGQGSKFYFTLPLPAKPGKDA